MVVLWGVYFNLVWAVFSLHFRVACVCSDDDILLYTACNMVVTMLLLCGYYFLFVFLR